MMRFISAVVILFILCFSSGEMEKCSTSECGNLTTIELCQTCLNCSSAETPALISFSSAPMFLFAINYSFTNSLENLYRPERLLRPPIALS